VSSRNVTIEHHHVVFVDGDPFEGVITVQRNVGGDGLVPQPRLEGFGQEHLVFHDEYAHGRLLRGSDGITQFRQRHVAEMSEKAATSPQQPVW
jgi:hypothetical protein